MVASLNLRESELGVCELVRCPLGEGRVLCPVAPPLCPPLLLLLPSSGGRLGRIWPGRAGGQAGLLASSPPSGLSVATDGSSGGIPCAFQLLELGSLQACSRVCECTFRGVWKLQ